MRKTKLLRRGRLTSYRCASDAAFYTVCYKVEGSCNGEGGRSEVRDGCSSTSDRDRFGEVAAGTCHARGSRWRSDWEGDSSCVRRDEFCKWGDGDAGGERRFSGLRLLGGEESLGEAVEQEARRQGYIGFPLVHGVLPHSSATELTCRRRCPDHCEGRRNRFSTAAGDPSGNVSAFFTVQYCATPQHGSPPAFSRVRGPTAPSTRMNKAAQFHNEISSGGSESFLANVAGAATPSTSQVSGAASAGTTGASGVRPAQLGTSGCRSGEIRQLLGSDTSSSAPPQAAAAASQDVSAAAAASSFGTSTAKDLGGASQMGRQPLHAGGLENAVVSLIAAAPTAVAASTSGLRPASTLATPGAAAFAREHSDAWRRVWGRRRKSVSHLGSADADNASGSRARMRLLRGKSSSEREEAASDGDDGDSYTSPLREDSVQRDTRSHSKDMEMSHAASTVIGGGNDSDVLLSNRALQSGQKANSFRARWDRCVANLRKTWWPRLNRGIRIGAITALALHLSVSKSLPGIGGILGQDWCINTYSLASTVLPEQSGAVISGLWVWVFTLACIAMLTFLLFPVLGFGATLGRILCLLLFLLIVSWLSVMRLPLIYKVPPFDTDVNTHSLTSFAYLYIPYTTASVILSQQYRAFDTDLKTGLQYVVEMNTGVLFTSLLGWALFLLQVVLPPWSSQRHIVRMKLSSIMGKVAEAIDDISESFVQLRRVLLSKNAHAPAARENGYSHSLDDLRAASRALQRSCQPLYTAIGSQTQLRVSIVASSTEPYLMYPGPAVFLFPFFARCCEVLIHNCMNVITLARHIDTLARDPLPVRLDTDAALANILLRTEPLLYTTMTAYQLCAELVSLRPDTLHRAAFKAKLRAGLEQLDCIDSQVSATFGLLRSPSMQEVSARQLGTADDVSVCLQRLLSRVSVGSNMGGSCPSEASAGYYLTSGVSATLERVDHSLLRTWSQGEDLLPMRYNKGTERSQPVSGTAAQGVLMSEATADRSHGGGAAAQERQPQQRQRPGFPLSGTPLSQKHQRNAASVAADTTATAEGVAAGGISVGVLRSRRLLRYFGLLKQAATTQPGKSDNEGATHTAQTASGGDAAAQDSKSAAAAAAGLEVGEVEMGQAGAHPAEGTPSLLLLGSTVRGSVLAYAPSNPDAASTAAAAAVAQTFAATAWGGAPAVAACTAAAAAGTGPSREIAPSTPGGVPVGAAAAARAAVTRGKGWGWDQGAASSLKLELHPIIEEPEQPHGKLAARKFLQEKGEAGKDVGGTSTKGTPTAQQTPKLSSAAGGLPPTAARAGGPSSQRQRRGADDSASADISVRTAARAPPGGVPTSDARAPLARLITAAGAGGAPSPDSTLAKDSPRSLEGFAVPSSTAAARLASVAGKASSEFLESHQTTTTGAADAPTGGKLGAALSDKEKRKGSLNLSGSDPSSSPPASSSGPLLMPLHRTDSPSVSSSPAGRLTLFSHAAVLSDTASLAPPSPRVPRAAAAAPASPPWAVTRSPLPGVSPHFLSGKLQHHRHSPLCHGLPPASAGAASSDATLVESAPLFVNDQMESTSPPLAPSTPGGGAVATALTAATIAASAAGGTRLPATSSCADLGTASSLTGSVDPVSGASAALLSSDTVAFVTGCGHAPLAGPPSPSAFSVAVESAAPSGGNSTSVTLLRSPASLAVAPVVTPRLASNKMSFGPNSLPMQRRPSPMDARTSNPAVVAGGTIPRATSPAVISPAVDAREPANLRGAGATRGTATGGWESGRKREGASCTSATPSRAGFDAEARNEAPAMSRTSAPPSRTATPRVAGSNVSRDAEARGEGLKSGLLSLFSLETSKASCSQSRGSPIPRLFQPPYEEQEHAHGESPRSNLTQDERRLNSGGISTPSSSSISSSTPSAESSTSSIDMDAVLTNLLQQNEDRQEAGLRATVDSAASSAVFPTTPSSAPPPAAPLPVHSPAVSPPAVGGRVAVTGTFPLRGAAPLSNATTFLAPKVKYLAAPSGTLAADVSPRVSPAAVATPAGATPAAATTVAGSAFHGAGNAAAAELDGGGEGRATKSSAAAESPVLTRVGEDLRRLLSIPRRSIARLASMQREDRESFKTGAAAAGVAEQEKSTGYKREEESTLTPGRKHRKYTDASISTGDRRRSTQPAGVLSPPTAPPGAAAGDSGVVEKGLTLPVVQADEKVADERESRTPLREASREAFAAAGFGEERRELTASEKTPVLGGTGIGIRERQGKERVRQKKKWLGRKGSSLLRIKRVWKRTPPPWAWLATRLPWSLVSVQRRQRQREEDLQALRALAHRSGREVGGSAAWSSVGVGQKRRLAAPADFSTTAELRQELRISKLIVSLYRICAMDTQELCSTVRGLCLAVVSPSWEGARQNAKMMMLSLAMIFIQLFFGLRNLVRADKWKWKGSEAFYRDVEAVHCMKLIFGLGVLFGCCLFYGPQIDRFLGGPHISGGPQTAKQWMILGFLCAHSFTYEGNTHKGLKRAVGTLLGGLAVELALMVTSNYVLLLFLTSLSIAVAVFVFASPEEPSSEFDREFGYIGQVFIWTVTFILNIIWIYEGLVPFPYLRDTVVRSRICGNVVGIGFSMMLTYVPPVFSAERAARTYCATLLKTCRRCILLMNAAFLSLTTSKEKPDKPPQVDVLESTNESTLASCTLLRPSSSPLTAINKPFHWARLWKFRRARPLARKRRDWKWIHKDKDPQKDAKKAFHYYLQQAEQLLRHHSTRLLVVARMLYAEGESSEHSPVWRVDRDVGEIMNRVEYLVMSVVDAVDNLCQLAMGTDPDLAALLHGSAVLARESVLTLLQQDRRNWERVMRCRAGKALLINMVRMVKAQSVCSHLLAREIQAAGLHFLDRIINWDWLRFPATMPPKYIRAVLRYIQGRSSIERYTNRVYESLAVCGRELREQGPFELDEWKGAIFSVLLIMEKCETRTYFMDEIHRFQLRSACRVVFANENPQLMLELFGSSSMLGTVEEAGANAETVRLRRCGAPSAPERRALVGRTRAYSYPLRGSAAVAADVCVVKEMDGAPQKKRASRRRSV